MCTGMARRCLIFIPVNLCFVLTNLSIHPPPFPDFSQKVYFFLRQSDSGGDGRDVCARCTELYKLAEGHEVCIYGEVLFALAYLIWKDRSTRNHVFTYISLGTSVLVPDFWSHNAYAEWLRSSVHACPSLNQIHIIAWVYDALRHAHLLP